MSKSKGNGAKVAPIDTQTSHGSFGKDAVHATKSQGVGEEEGQKRENVSSIHTPTSVKVGIEEDIDVTYDKRYGSNSYNKRFGDKKTTSAEREFLNKTAENCYEQLQSAFFKVLRDFKPPMLFPDQKSITISDFGCGDGRFFSAFQRLADVVKNSTIINDSEGKPRPIEGTTLKIKAYDISKNGLIRYYLTMLKAGFKMMKKEGIEQQEVKGKETEQQETEQEVIQSDTTQNYYMPLKYIKNLVGDEPFVGVGVGARTGTEDRIFPDVINNILFSKIDNGKSSDDMGVEESKTEELTIYIPSNQEVTEENSDESLIKKLSDRLKKDKDLCEMLCVELIGDKRIADQNLAQILFNKLKDNKEDNKDMLLNIINDEWQNVTLKKDNMEVCLIKGEVRTTPAEYFEMVGDVDITVSFFGVLSHIFPMAKFEDFLKVFCKHSSHLAITLPGKAMFLQEQKNRAKGEEFPYDSFADEYVLNNTRRSDRDMEEQGLVTNITYKPDGLEQKLPYRLFSEKGRSYVERLIEGYYEEIDSKTIAYKVHQSTATRKPVLAFLDTIGASVINFLRNKLPRVYNLLGGKIAESEYYGISAETSKEKLDEEFSKEVLTLGQESHFSSTPARSSIESVQAPSVITRVTKVEQILDKNPINSVQNTL